jgi:hypothetical protein
MRWCIWYGAMKKCKDAMLSNFSRLSKNVWHQKPAWFNQAVNHPSFLARSSQHSNEKKSTIKAIWFKILLRNVTTTKSYHKEDSMVGWKIMSKRIAFGSPIANHYAQSNSITSEQENSVTTLIRPWLQTAVSKFKFGAVPSKIWLRVENQKGWGHPQLSNGYLLVFIG